MTTDTACLSPEEESELIADIERDKRDRVCIRHHYDIGDQRVFLRRLTGDVDAKRAAVYLQFKCEEWFGVEKMLTNLGVAALLVTFYGFQHGPADTICTDVDMYSDRERACGAPHRELMADASLFREGLREAMAPHVIG